MSRLRRGGLVDRQRPIAFRFDGRAYSGFEGDSLASALIANDVRLVGRSFKYHRPRGILTAGSEEPNALVTLHRGARAEPNCRATTVELFDGLEAVSQNRWPSLAVDLLSVNQLFAPILVAGFYYKTFMWPKSFWERVYEPLIRRAAGIGALSMLPDPDCYDRDHGFCDLLVIGAGPAGLAAALAAARSGARVIVADDDSRMGGRLLRERHRIDGVSGPTWVSRVLAELAGLSNVRLLPRTNVFGVYDGGEYGAIERLTDHLGIVGGGAAAGRPRQRYWKILARRAVLATGAIEQPIVFGGNDRPGVMMASALGAYANRYAVTPAKRAVIFTSTDSGWQAAEDLLAQDVEVAAIVDPRGGDAPNAEALRRRGVEILSGASVVETLGRRLSGVCVRTADGSERRIACDTLGISGGWSPAIGLTSHLGDRPVWLDTRRNYFAGKLPPGLVPVGACNGEFTLAAVLTDGTRTGSRLAEELGFSPAAVAVPVAAAESAAMEPLSFVPAMRGKAFVDFQNDVTAADVRIAAREGFRSVEHMKRYTTLGMATDQGKTSNLAGNVLLGDATGRAVADVGTILARPPAQPVAIGALAGHHRGSHFRPVRQAASHDWAAANGASFVEAGLWKRAQWFSRPGDRHWRDSVDREVALTRGGVGICDVSTLGKIDVQGADAGELLDRLYINTFSSLAIGKARYGVMLREDGIVFDDGTASRFAEDHYFLTTTTANAARVTEHIDYAAQVLWPGLDVQAVSVTEQWATFSVAGPEARPLVQAAFPDVDLLDEAFPFMAATECAFDGVPARIFRLSFSGERAYEVSVGAAHGQQLLARLLDLGRPFGITPYGTEALGVMRIEKGHPAGPELNGQTTAGDLGLARMMSKKKDYIGRVMAARPGLVDPARPVLVGLRPLDTAASFTAGAHLFRPGKAPVAVHDEGHVSSVAFSPSLGHSIALAFLSHGAERHGEHIVAHDLVRGNRVEAEICSPVFLDPEGVRVRG